jgi:hypothetical protein
MKMQINLNRSLKTLIALTFAYVTFFGAVIFSVSAGAEVKASGTFVPAACGEVVQADEQPVVAVLTSVCMGNITGDLAKSSMGAFEFRDEVGNAAVYRVTQVSNLLVKLMSGAVRSQVFMVGSNGDEIAMKINRMGDGSFANAAGQIGTAKFIVPAFAPVAVAL